MQGHAPATWDMLNTILMADCMAISSTRKWFQLLPDFQIDNRKKKDKNSDWKV